MSAGDLSGLELELDLHLSSLRGLTTSGTTTGRMYSSGKAIHEKMQDTLNEMAKAGLPPRLGKAAMHGMVYGISKESMRKVLAAGVLPMDPRGPCTCHAGHEQNAQAFFGMPVVTIPDGMLRRRVSVKKHTHPNGNPGYHKRIQKKWDAKFGMKEVDSVLVFDPQEVYKTLGLSGGFRRGELPMISAGTRSGRSRMAGVFNFEV